MAAQARGAEGRGGTAAMRRALCRAGGGQPAAQPAQAGVRYSLKKPLAYVEANVRCSGYNERDAQTHWAEKMVRKCRAYRTVNYTDELPDMVRDTRRLPHDVFLAESNAGAPRWSQLGERVPA